MPKDELDVFGSSSDEEINTTVNKPEKPGRQKKRTTTSRQKKSASEREADVSSVRLKKRLQKKQTENRRKSSLEEAESDSDDFDYDLNQDLTARKATQYFSSLDQITNKYCQSKSKVVNLDKLDRNLSKGRLSYYEKADQNDEISESNDLESLDESESIESSSDDEVLQDSSIEDDFIKDLQEEDEESNHSFDLDNYLIKDKALQQSLPNFASNRSPLMGSWSKRKHEWMEKPPRCSTPLLQVKRPRATKVMPASLPLKRDLPLPTVNYNVFNVQVVQNFPDCKQTTRFDPTNASTSQTKEEFNDQQVRNLFEKAMSSTSKRRNPFNYVYK